jgi:hypothetical protein
MLHRRTLLRATVLAALIRTFRGEREAFAQEKKPAWEPELVTLTKRGEPILYGEAAFPMAYWKDQSTNDFPWFVSVPEKKGWYIDWDCERQEIKHLIVHHTATTNPTATPQERRQFLTYLSELERNRDLLYRGVFESKAKTPFVKGLPIRSGHVLEGEGETFEPYHHLIYPNGDLVTRLVPYRKVGNKYFVEMIGWQAGNWPVNCSSVSVALVGDYDKTKPPAEVIEKLDALVKYYQGLIPAIAIKPHREVRLLGPTACPGEWFEEWAKTIKK